MAKDSYYFKHDAHARHDPKIKALIKKYNIEGYGRFWIIVEMLRESSNYKIEDQEYVWGSIAEEFKTDISTAKIFINDCIDVFHLFVRDEGFFYSASLLERMIKLDEIRSKRKKSSDDYWERKKKEDWNN